MTYTVPVLQSPRMDDRRRIRSRKPPIACRLHASPSTGRKLANYHLVTNTKTGTSMNRYHLIIFIVISIINIIIIIITAFFILIKAVTVMFRVASPLIFFPLCVTVAFSLCTTTCSVCACICMCMYICAYAC